MKYFNFTYLLLFVAAAVLFWAWVLLRLKQRFLLTAIENIVLEQQSKNESLTFFSSRILQKLADVLAKQNRKTRQRILKDLQKGKYENFLALLPDSESVIGCMAHFDIKKALLRAEEESNKQPNNVNLLILSAFLYAENFDYEKMQEVVENIRYNALNKLQKAYFLMLRAKLYLYLGNMNEACDDAMKALRVFKKKHLFFEEAKLYMLLGEIYRVCAWYDLSQMMFETSKKLFDKMNLFTEKAKVTALLGMLLAGQKRFDEAAEFLMQSRKVFKKVKFFRSEAEVINQQALNYLLIGKPALCKRYASQALNVHIKCENIRGIAQSYDLIAIAALRKKEYENSLKALESAEHHYLQAKNYPAYLEALFLKATAFYEKNEPDEAEKICKKLLELNDKHKTCFHIANVYTMLGNIYLQRKKFGKAKVWFEKSLAREQADERYAGMALDYFNLAVVEKKLRHEDAFNANLEKSLNAAEKCADENLCAIIRKQIAKIT